MSEFPIDEVHHMLDSIEEIIASLDDRPDTIEVADLGDLCLIILEITGWTNTAYAESSLGINPSLLNKFVKMRGSVKKRDAFKIADRVRSFLKSQDQLSVKPTIDQKSRKTRKKAITYAAERWVFVGGESDVKQKIGLVSVLLDGIIAQTKGANAPAEEQGLSEIERQQLIAVLETALNILKSPLVETGILREAEKSLKDASAKAAKGELQKGLSRLMEMGAGRIGELIISLFT